MPYRTYYQNNPSLAFQFTVSEYVSVFHLFKTLKTSIKSENKDSIKKIFNKLIGPLGNDVNQLSGYYDRGLLIKLQYSCKHFSSCAPEHRQISLKLISKVEQIIKISYQIGNSFEANEVSKKDSFTSSLVLLDLKIQKCLQKIQQLLSKLFLQFETDEKVLLFLMQNHLAIDDIYQSPFVAKLFSKIFSDGVVEAEKYLIKQYSHKGYHQLLPQISLAAKELLSQVQNT